VAPSQTPFLPVNGVKLNANANLKIPQDYILIRDFLEKHRGEIFSRKNAFKEDLTVFQKQTTLVKKL
jgi:hypothetical protein